MFRIRDCEHVNAPIERCFRLSTHLALVADVLDLHPTPGEGLRSEGMVASGDIIRWQGWKFGLPQVHVSRIARFEPPDFFQDVMEQGRFRRFEHDHHFHTVGDHTLILDYIRFSLPFGLAGRMVGSNIVLPHVVRLLRARMTILKRIAESDEWRSYLPVNEEHEMLPLAQPAVRR